jgi:hypothetical protein
MSNISWDHIFPREIPGKGASEAELQAFVSSHGKPLTAEEVHTVIDAQAHPSQDSGPAQASDKRIEPRKWQIPARPLPLSYLSLLKWSNGGSFYNGHRGFNFLSTSAVREFLLNYCFPEYMPGAMPFAFDGDNNFYLFDMRSDPVEGEYPILFVRGENLSYANAVQVASSLREACQGKTDPVQLLKD